MVEKNSKGRDHSRPFFSPKYQMEEAFLYCWTDHRKEMLYVGYHKGSPEDGYICSSKTMKAAWKERPEDFTRKIIATGTLTDMKALETKVLCSMNAARDPKMYNKHNGGRNFVCVGHTNETRNKMSSTWKSRNQWNCDPVKAHAAWPPGSKHTDETKERMRRAAPKHSKSRSARMTTNNPMKNPETIAKMLATRKLKREAKNDSHRS